MESIQLTKTARHLFTEESSVQVKMFIHNDAKDAEKAISQWLNENDVVIHHIAQSQSEKGGSFIFVISLFYQPAS